MCSSNRWRFNSKKDLLDWARKERDIRWNSFLSFAPASELKEETKHYKLQNINFRLDLLKTDFRDVFCQLNTDAIPHPNKYARYMQLKEDVGSLHVWAEDGYQTALHKYEDVKAKQGRKEDLEYWLRAKTIADQIKNDVFSLLNKLKEKCMQFDETNHEKRDKKEKQKNVRKEIKRKARSMEKMMTTEPQHSLKKQKGLSDYFRKDKTPKYRMNNTDEWICYTCI